MGLFDRRFENRQIDLAQRAFVNDCVHIVPVKFRIVSQEMFYSCADPLTLHSLDVAHGDARRQEGVFAKVFEIPAVHRSTIDIHSRPKEKMHTLGARIPSNLSAHLLRQGWIPCCGQSYST